jgi:hypothetical protein
MNQALPLGIALGITSIVIFPVTWWQPWANRLVNMIVFTILGVSFTYSFVFVQPGLGDLGWPRIYPPKKFPNFLLPRTWPPMFRSDIAEIRALADMLRSVASSNDRVLVAASSVGLNPSVVKRILEGEGGPTVIDSPQVDSRDWMPLGELLAADIVVVPSRPLLHLPPGEQIVVDVIRRIFSESWPISTAFEKLPGSFALLERDGAVTVMIFRRTSPVKPELVTDTLERMRIVQNNVPMARALIISSYPAPISIPRSEKIVHLHPAAEEAHVPTKLFIIDDSISSLQFNLLDERCRGLRVRFPENGFSRAIATPERSLTIPLSEVVHLPGELRLLIVEGLDKTPESVYFCSTEVVLN